MQVELPVLDGGTTHKHPKRIGRSDSFEKMIEIEMMEAKTQEEEIRKQLAALRASEADHDPDHHKINSKKQRELMEKKRKLKNTEAMLDELPHLETTVHAEKQWLEGDHDRHIVVDHAGAAAPQRVGQRAATPVLAEKKRTYEIKQAQGGRHKSHYKLRPAPSVMQIEDTIIHDYKDRQLISRRAKAEEAFTAAYAQYEVVKAEHPNDFQNQEYKKAWENMATVEAHLDRMNKLADGIPRPEDGAKWKTMNLDLYLREVEAYDSLVVQLEAPTTTEEWLKKKNEQRQYRGFHIGAHVVTTKNPRLGVVIRQETRGNECGVHVDLKALSLTGKGKQDKWIPLSDQRGGCSQCFTKRALIEPVNKRLAGLIRDDADLSRFDE